ALTEEAEAHGGEDLKTAIAWRGARAEALARRGRVEQALALAREAVALAEPTDRLTDHADALMALAAVAGAAGDDAGARDAAAQARDLYGRKGHVVGGERATALAGAAPAAAPQVVPAEERAPEDPDAAQVRAL